MIGILLLLAPVFFIWRYYSELAFEHERSRAGFGLLGIGVYIVSYFVCAILAAIVALAMIGEASPVMGLLVDVAGIVLGAAISWLVWLLLKRSWEKDRDAKNGLLDN